MRSPILIVALFLPWTGQAEPLPDADYAALARAVIDQVAIPAYAEHARATERLTPAIDRHCMGTAPADTDAIQAAFGEAMDAWQRAWPFTFGPVMHGAFSPDGAFLYTSENRFEDGAGVIGVWEAARGWRRAGEWPSHGVGPHEIRMSGQGTMLAVANGGIRTHPDTGRAKLNLDTMAPSLAIVDTADGRLVRSASLGPRLHRLSIRHLDTDRDGRIVAAMQHQGARTDPVPLVAFERGGRLAPAPVPAGMIRRMRGYAGSVSFDGSGDYAAASHPQAGIVSLWAVRSARLLAVAALDDVCGVAPGAGAGSFIATGADGRIAGIDARTGKSTILARSDGSHWDNHLLALRA